ncbi:hypothetical protein B0I35DRAFT_405656 [Stachybotrys elegans]|uniref:Rho-GAP domain-containing protein n=1 Tax=Stachybotrys elegans TaxID=80388 RepID=A0A8K0SWC6_9HYPO|nr:hypothetical protein B0I35DRAFT_405656 [Stachybotrys elegans]
MASAAHNQNPASPPHHHPVQHPNAASPPSKRDLKSWWKGFKIPSKHQETQDNREHVGIFGVPLRQSITYANVAISLIDENGQSYIYGYVPIVVAKCGVFLKEKATGVEGIFRLSGSEKRIKELKTIFDSPDRYGKGLVWDGYTVHDAANVLRRYLNDLPEPVVPLDLYEKFRDPLRGATKQAVGDAEGPQFVENFDEKAAITTYQTLITELPPLNRQLLLYLLDLLAVFAAKADENRMNSQNLAAIFQPGMLSHPNHAMAPEEYRLNQCVIIFLIENQDHFLIGMQGTAADEKTRQEVQSGPSAAPMTPNPKRTSGLGRSASNASAGAESVRREGMIRRNRSVSSRNSRHDGSTTPNSPATATTPTSGLGRSNTVPSKKSPAIIGGKLRKADGTPIQPPALLEPLTQAHPQETHPSSERSSLAPAAVGTSSLSPEAALAAGRSQEKLLDVPQEHTTPSKERNLPAIFQRSPSDNLDKRQPNKLKKKRIPGSLNPSAHSSNSSLPAQAHSPSVELVNPMEIRNPLAHQAQDAPQGTAPAANQQAQDSPDDHTPRASQVPVHDTLRPGDAARGKSPPASVHSSFNEGSDLDQSIDDVATAQADQSDKEKKSRWRMSRTRKDEVPYNEASSRSLLGSNDNAEMSNTSIGTFSSKPRKSFTGDSVEPGELNHDVGRENRDESKGPIGWIRNKYREAKENAEIRRNKSPPADRGHTHSISLLPQRGKSIDIKREPRDEEKETQPALPTQAPTAQTQGAAPAQPEAQTTEKIGETEKTEPAAGETPTPPLPSSQPQQPEQTAQAAEPATSKQ